MDLVSIIVPVYKAERFLHRCVESITQQTYQNLEIILVDDASPDECPQLCDEWAAKDSRIRVIHKENAGPGQARNSGLDVVSGQYIMFVDSDDYLDLDAVSVLHEQAVHDHADLVIGKHIMVFDNVDPPKDTCNWTQTKSFTKQQFLAQLGKNKILLSPWGKIYKRELLNDLRFPSLSCGEDIWLFQYIFERCSIITLSDALIYYYYQHSNSIVHSKSQKTAMDALSADISMVQYLLSEHAFESARGRYLRCVCEIAVMENQMQGRKALEEIITPSIRRQLMHGASLKMRIQSMYLYFPFIYTLIQNTKKLIK